MSAYYFNSTMHGCTHLLLLRRWVEPQRKNGKPGGEAPAQGERSAHPEKKEALAGCHDGGGSDPGCLTT